jgi:carboxyl-terminal processing protease
VHINRSKLIASAIASAWASASTIFVITGLCCLITQLDCRAKSVTNSGADKGNAGFRVNRHDAETYAKKVNAIIQANFYSPKLAKIGWEALDLNRNRILESQNLRELSERINAPLKELQSSHTQFITENDEAFYFLHSLFGPMNKKIPNPKMDFTGITTGGAGMPFNMVRYVLDGSPAALAGVCRGDVISGVNGHEYIGQMSFAGLSNSKVWLQLLRKGEKIERSLTPVFETDYPQYVKAIEKSVQTFPSNSGRLGYIRYWCGNEPAHVAFERSVLSEKIVNTEGLIIDLRDGYGANSAPDFDVLYRPPSAYPKFQAILRSGKAKVDQDYYDKPVVVLINRGSRSGKELLAYGIKRSGRGTLVGENTAGYFLGGRLFPIDNRASLYLAVIDIYLDAETRLEKVGVAPDVTVPDDAEHPSGFNDQLETAKKVLADLIEKKRSSQKEGKADN